MALPKIQHTLYEHKLFGLNKTIKFRPFTNHEQKTLLLAKEAKGTDNEKNTVLEAVSEIVRGCTNGKVEGKDLATFDIEDLFLRIRAKSVGEEITLKYRYDYVDEEGIKKSNFIDVPINIDDIKVTVLPEHDRKIMLSGNIGVMMKYPTFTILENVKTSQDIALACIDYIFDEKEIYNMSEVTDEELQSFYDDIDTKGLLAIQKFFDTMPKLRHTVEITVKPGVTEKITFEGLQDFFT